MVLRKYLELRNPEMNSNGGDKMTPESLC
jgi:hypothetical protein